MKNKILLLLFGIFFIGMISSASALSIDFASPTPANGTTQTSNSIYVNVSSSDAGTHYALLDWNNLLVGWWRLEQGNGTFFVDDTSKNNGTCSNGKCPVYNSSGQYGGAYTFNGAQYINMSYRQDFNESAPGANFSYGGWLYLYSGQATNFYPMGRGAASAQSPFGFWFANTSVVKFLVGKGPEAAGICTDWLSTNNLVSTWEANVWQHWFFVKNGAKIYLYKNGTMVSSYTMSNDTICDVKNLPFLIGTGSLSSGQSGYMNGSADEVVFFNRALNNTEVAALYNASASQYYRNFTGLAPGNYNFKGYTVNSTGSKNQTDTRIVILSDGISPNVTLSSPAQNYTTATSNTINITFQCNATDNSALANISLYITNPSNQSFGLNQTANITGTSNSTSWTLTMAPGNYTWNCLASDSAGNSAFAYLNRNLRIDYSPDMVYPIFSNYWDNNGTLVRSGIGLFNVTVQNTNGSVYLNINGQSIKATNLTANSYNASFSFSSGGNYMYNWSAYGNGTNSNLNTTANFYYIVHSLNITNFYQYPANVSPGQSVYSYCVANSTRNASSQLNMASSYKNNASSTWQTAAPSYIQRRIIWSLGDSITRGSSDYNPGSPAGPSNPVNHSYQYWLDYYMNSNASGLDGSGISIYNKGQGSDTCEGMATRFNSNIGNNSIVILMCGINDFSLGRNYTQAEDSVLTIYAEAMAKNDTLIILEVLPDSNGLFCGNLTPFNAWIDSNFIGNPNVTVISGLHSAMTNGNYCYYNSSLFDGVHPNTLGHKFIGRYIWQALNEQYYDSWMANITIPSNENSSFYDFSCNVSDGVVSSYSVSYQSVRIASLPSISIISPANITYNNRTILVNISSNGNSAWFTNSSGQNESYTIPVYRTWNEGSNTLYAYANDSLGNVNLTSVIFNVDTIAPVISIISPVNTTYNISSIFLNYTAADSSGISMCWYSLNLGLTNITLAGCSTATISSSEGSNTLKLYANDSVGNVNSTSIMFSVDTIPPSISIISPVNTIYSNATLLVNISSDGNRIWFTNSSGQNETYTTPVYRLWNEGSNTLYVYANDSANNVNSSSVSFTVYSTQPMVQFVSPTPANGTTQTSNSIYVNVSSSDAGTHYALMDWNNLLVGWWRLEQGNGTFFADDTGKNNGTCSNGGCPNYTASGRYGGAYTFNGAQYINMSYKQDFNESAPASNFSYGGWLYLYSGQIANFYPMGRGAANAQTPFSFWFANTSVVKFLVGKGPEAAGICTDWLSTNNLVSTWEANVWQHWFFVKNGAKIYLYKNGTMVSSYTMSNDTICDVKNLPFILGAGSLSSGPVGYMNGSADEVVFFNRALNNTEVAALYNASASQYYKNFTNLDDATYTLKAYAVNTAGNKNQTETRTIIVKSDTTPPAAVTGLASQSAGRTWIYWNWTNPTDSDFSQALIYINGTNLANTSNNYYNVTGLSSHRSYTITVRTKDTRGNVNITDVNSTASTANTPPTAINVTINPSNPSSSDDLICNYSYSDADSDTESGTAFAWYKNNALQAGIVTQILNNSYTSFQENWTCQVTPSDGTDNGTAVNSSAKTIQNGAPVAVNITLTSTDSQNRTNGTLMASWAFSDPDMGDTYQGNQTKWYKNNAEQASLANLSRVNGSYTAKGESWKVSVSVYDGSQWGSWTNSSALIIQNTLPAAPAVDVLPNIPNDNDDLAVTITIPSIDADNDTLTYSYQWYKNSILQAGQTSSTLSKLLTTPGEIWKCIVTPNDGTGNGATGEDNVTINGTIPTYLVNLISPNNGATWNSSNNVVFEYNTSMNATNCSLIIRDIANQTDVNITPNATESFAASLSNGNYNWSVNCFDNIGNTNSSAIWVFTVSYLYCGDGSCNNGETCSSCSSDCGACSGGGNSGGGGGGGSLSCTTNWSCTNWSACIKDSQERACIDLNKCPGNFGKPDTKQKCQSCLENWACTNWTECSSDGLEVRACTDGNSCGTSLSKPTEIQSCKKPDCNDKIQNQGEFGVDCGGPCAKRCDKIGITGKTVAELAPKQQNKSVLKYSIFLIFLSFFIVVLLFINRIETKINEQKLAGHVNFKKMHFKLLLAHIFHAISIIAIFIIVVLIIIF